MRFALRNLVIAVLLSVASSAQFIDINTQTKGSRLPSWGVDSGSANAYAITTIQAIGSGGVLQTGSSFGFIATHANTSASTLVVDAGSTIAIKKSVSTALVSGDIPLNAVVLVTYDGTNFQCVTCFTSNAGTVTSVICGTGLSGGTITTSGTCALANTAVTPGSYTSTNLTVDAQGRLTAASNGTGGVTSGTTPTEYDVRRLAHGMFVSAAHINTGTEKIYTFASFDGLSWTQFGTSPAFSDTDRDPSIIHYNSQWWIATTAGGGTNATNNFNLYSSSDLDTWSSATSVSTGGSVSNTWAPHWFLDNDGSVHIFVALSTAGSGGPFVINEMHPTNNAMTSWSSPVAITTTGASNVIDPDVVRIGSTYYMFLVEHGIGGFNIDLANSSSLTGPYTVTQTGNWASWGVSSCIEGPQLVQMDDSKWRLYFVSDSGCGLSSAGEYYSETTDSTLATGWSAATSISSFSAYNHPVPIRAPGLLEVLNNNGFVRCDYLTPLSGDVSSSGCVVTASGVNGAVAPVSASVIGTNSSKQLIAATVHGIFTPLTCSDSSGSGTAQVCSTSPTFTPASGDTILYKTTTANTGDVTINVNSSSAAHVRKWLGSSVLAASDLPANIPILLTYDGTFWESYAIGNAPSGGGSGTVSSGGPRQMAYYPASATSVSGLISPLTIDIPPTSGNALDDEMNGSSLSGQWTQTNVGSSTFTESGGTLTFAAPAATGGDQLRVLSQAVPGSTPYTVTCKFSPNFNVLNNTHQHVGMFISDGTKYVTFSEHWTNSGALNLETNKWTNTTTFSAAYKGSSSPLASFDWQYLLIQNDGTNLNFNLTRSGAGAAVTTWDSRLKGDFLGTITTWGMFTENVSGAGAAVGVFDWCRRTQ